MRLFRTKGYAATTADDIAVAAGMSRASFFNHFGNKSAVLRFFGEELEETIGTTLAARDPAASPLAELQRILHAMATAAEAQRANLRIVLVHSLEDGTYFSHPSPARARIARAIAALIADAQHRGEVRTDLAAPALAAQVVALYNNAVVAILFSGQRAEDAVARLWEFACGGLTTTTAARTATSPSPGRKKAR